jgi:DNA alkylation repair enzyme
LICTQPDRAETLASEFSARIQQSLTALADPGKATAMAAYMKGRFDFLGVQTPARRQATVPIMRAFTGHPLDAARELWALPAREYQYVAVDLLRRENRRLSAGDLPALEALVQDKSWWDSVDGLAVTIGSIVAREPQLVGRMDALIRAPDFWLRGKALHLLPALRRRAGIFHPQGHRLGAAPIRPHEPGRRAPVSHHESRKTVRPVLPGSLETPVVRAPKATVR